jgi:hypothetical protein
MDTVATVWDALREWWFLTIPAVLLVGVMATPKFREGFRDSWQASDPKRRQGEAAPPTPSAPTDERSRREGRD